MSEVRIGVLFIALLFPMGSFGQQTKIQPRKPSVVPGELIIKYRDAGFGRVGAESVQQTVTEKYRLETLSRVPYFGVQRVRVGEERIASVTESLKADPAIAFVTRNYYVYPDQLTPNDPEWKKLWGMQKIGMPAAWAKTTGNSNVIVAVLDTGVDYTHPDLAGNLWKTPSGDYGMSFCTDSSDPKNARTLPPRPGAMDSNGHGTHVSGTIAATGNNALNVAGVAWKVQIMALRFLCERDGRGTTGDAIRALEYAVVNGAHIANNSWGGAPPDVALETAIQEAAAKGILFIASAGNYGSDQGIDPNYPAAYQHPNVIGVAASDSQDNLASFSNWSPTLVHIAAPGVQILSTLPGKSVGTKDGTSMAAPHVSGCAALLKAVDMNRKAADLKRLLLDRADALPSLQGKVQKGRLNCANALR